MQDLYQRVTEKIISQLETGQPLPWIKPWKTTSEPFPVNAKTTRPYRGINVLMLQLEAQSRGFCRNRWVTYRQAQELGGQVRKGAKGSPVILYRPLEPSASSVPLTERDPLQSNDKRAVMRTFSVFNIEEVDGLQESSQPTPVADGWPPVMIAEGIFYDSGASFRYGGDRAFYRPKDDSIQLPEKQAFRSREDFYSTALHELVHWTGHRSRCDRPFGQAYADDVYAMEELIAELGAAFLCAHCQLDGEVQHTSYVASWLRILKANNRAIFSAAAKAQVAVDYLLKQGAAPID